MALPDKIGRYPIRGELGRGGMGRILRGHDPVMRRDVAIKLVELKGGEEFAEACLLFHREARALAQLEHPNILKALDYSGPDADPLYVVFELLNAPTLDRALLKHQRRLDENKTACIAHELALALVYAHDRGVMHRDVKPSNIFWFDSGRIVLADFGLAKPASDPTLLGETLLHQDTILRGSPSYIAPELLKGEKATPAVDIYGLGLVIYECLFGRPAFEGKSTDAILDAVMASQGTPKNLLEPATGLEKFCARCLVPDPGARPDGSDAVKQLRDILDELEVADPRLELRGMQRSVENEDDDEDTSGIFSPTQVDSVTVPRPSGAWETLASRGPFVFGLLAVALLLGTGAHLVERLPLLMDNVEKPRAVSLDATMPPVAAKREPVLVLITFDGSASVGIDGKTLGHWTDRIRLTLTAGHHKLFVEQGGQRTERHVLLIPGTEPRFDF